MCTRKREKQGARELEMKRRIVLLRRTILLELGKGRGRGEGGRSREDLNPLRTSPPHTHTHIPSFPLLILLL